MRWPSLDEYNLAIQTPKLSFSDRELQKGKIITNSLGLPRAISGNFAVVYEVSVGKKKLAVRCFSREVTKHRERYAWLSEWLDQHPVSSFVRFQYLHKGIRINATWYPIMKMEWVDGQTLESFLSNCIKMGLLSDLGVVPQKWVYTVEELRAAHIAHGDLQHGNIIITPSLDIKLIDYDGIFIPPLQGEEAIELGHRNYQHPFRKGTKRTAALFDLKMDNFPALVIYVSLLAVQRFPELWDKYHIGENLIFTERDYLAPRDSKVLDFLLNSRDPDLQYVTEQLLFACLTPPDEIPFLEDIITRKSPLRAPKTRARKRSLVTKPLPSEQVFVTPKVAAQLLGESPRTVMRYIKQGKLKATKIGGEWHIALEGVQRLAKLRRPSATSPMPSNRVRTQVSPLPLNLKQVHVGAALALISLILLLFTPLLPDFADTGFFQTLEGGLATAFYHYTAWVCVHFAVFIALDIAGLIYLGIIEIHAWIRAIPSQPWVRILGYMSIITSYIIAGINVVWMALIILKIVEYLFVGIIFGLILGIILWIASWIIEGISD